LERAYNQHFNTLWNMVSKAKFALMKRFFETIASRVKHVYDIQNRDLESWLKAVMSPLETQVKEHHLQLRRRLDSIKRIHRASGELEERLSELGAQEEGLDAQLRALGRGVGGIDDIDLRALRDRAVRAFGLADIAIDAFVGDDECHGWDLSGRPEESTFATGARPCPRASRGQSDARTRRRRPRISRFRARSS